MAFEDSKYERSFQCTSRIISDNNFQTFCNVSAKLQKDYQSMYQEFRRGSPPGLLAPKSGSPDQTQVAQIQYLLG